MSKSVSDEKEKRTESVPEEIRHDETHSAIFPSGKEFFSWLAVATLGAIFLFLALTSSQILNTAITPGDVAERDLKAPASATVVDPAGTRQAVKAARERVIPVFRVDRSEDVNTLNQVKERLAIAEMLQKAGVHPVVGLQSALSPRDQLYLLTCPKSTFDVMVSKPEQNNESESESSTIQTEDKRLRQRLWFGGMDSSAMQTEPGKKLSRRQERALQKARANVFADRQKAVGQLALQRKALADFVSSHPHLGNDAIVVAVAVDPERFSAYKTATIDATKRLLYHFNRFPVEDKRIWEDTVVEFVPDSWNQQLREHTATIVSFALEPNLVIDPQGTKHQVDHVVSNVKPITKEIKQGQVIVQKGEKITEEKARLLQNLGITNIASTPVLVMLGCSLLTALVIAGLFLFTYEPQHFFSGTSIGLMYTVGIITCAAASLIGKVFPEFVPIPGAALILTIFFRRRVALALLLPLVTLIAVDRIISVSHLMALTIAAFAAILTYSRQRNSLMVTGFVVAIAQACGYLLAFAVRQLIPVLYDLGAHPNVMAAFHMAFPSVPDIQAIGLHFLGGFLISMVAIGSLPFLENIFGLISPHGLAELTEANQPLLRELEEKAPGTYQHSLAVANLAEAGAKAVDGDVVLVRAGALYHDIGKMVRPKFFIENQLGAKNPHDSMTPEESRDRVLAHVTDGIELARKHALPRMVSDFIPMHQGTTLMAYFYHKACQRDGADNVDPMFYRYPGPKPNSKETAIVMLADVAEAVTHSMKSPTEEEVEVALGKVFQNRWDDAQFSDTPLTYDELQRVKLAFVRVWRTLHHDRLKYPSTNTGKMPISPENENGEKVDAAADGKTSQEGRHEVHAGHTADYTAAQTSKKESVEKTPPETLDAQSAASGAESATCEDCAANVLFTLNEASAEEEQREKSDDTDGGAKSEEPAKAKAEAKSAVDDN